MISTLLSTATILVFSILSALTFTYLHSRRFRRAMHVVAYASDALKTNIGQCIAYEGTDGSEREGSVITIGYQGYEIMTTANGIRFIYLAPEQPHWRLRFVESDANPFTDS